MVRKFVVYKNEMHEVDSFLEGREQWEQVVKYEDYAKLAKSVRACVAAISEGSLTVEHVQGYLEGIIVVLDD